MVDVCFFITTVCTVFLFSPFSCSVSLIGLALLPSGAGCLADPLALPAGTGRSARPALLRESSVARPARPGMLFCSKFGLIGSAGPIL